MDRLEINSKWPLWFFLFLPVSVVLFFVCPHNDWLRMFIRLASLLLFLRFVWTLLYCSRVLSNLVGMNDDTGFKLITIISFLLYAECIVLFIISWTSNSNIIGISDNMSLAKKTDLVVVSSIIFGVISLFYFAGAIASLIECKKITDVYDAALWIKVGPWSAPALLVIYLIYYR